MRQVRLRESLNVKLLPEQRIAIERLAEIEEMSLGEAARELLNAGIQARGLMT
jgi:predicted HTH domain antitoxin